MICYIYIGKWAMSVNYDKTIGVVVTPPTAATQGDRQRLP